MTTRRDFGQPSHPNLVGMASRVPERQVTEKGVTQHAVEILTDQDFLITSPATGESLFQSGGKWINRKVTAADVQPGTFEVGNFVFDGEVTTSGRLITTISTSSVMHRMFNMQGPLDSKGWDIRISTNGSLQAVALNDDGTSLHFPLQIDHNGTVLINFHLRITVAGDGASVLRLNTERPWDFIQRSTGASSRLALRSLNGAKQFDIENNVGGIMFRFDTSTGNLEALSGDVIANV